MHTWISLGARKSSGKLSWFTRGVRELLHNFTSFTKLSSEYKLSMSLMLVGSFGGKIETNAKEEGLNVLIKEATSLW